MRGFLPQSVISQIIDEVNIVDIIGNYVVLSKFNANYRAICPFHQEKTPSFFVNTTKKFYYCFGCQHGGNVIDFLKKYKQISFTEAIE